MTIDLAYIVPCDERAKYEPFVERFFNSQWYADVPSFSLHVIAANGELTTGLPVTCADVHKYYGTGRDVGAFQWFAHASNADMLVCCNTQVHFKRAGWLARFVEVWEKYGPGFYGASASREHCPLRPPNSANVNPHIRTSCFCIPPAWLREYPIHIQSREDGYRFESGDRNFTIRQMQMARAPRMVTWNHIVPYPFTQKIVNGYRNGDQSELLAFDRATDEYDASPPAQKRELERLCGT